MSKNEIRRLKARQCWVDSYLELGSVSKAARKCGIPRSTLYRWINRFEKDGLEGLKEQSKKPKKLANEKIDPKQESLILKIRDENKYGPQRIAIHLLREFNLNLSHSTIWRVLRKYNAKPLKRYKPPASPIRYNRPTPGDRVQIDVMKVMKGQYQFTAIDDCTRLRVLRLYPNKKSESAVDFLMNVLDNFPFPVQRVQTDWGTEFFNDFFQSELMEHFIKFRPIKPRSPHLNGKVERSQKTDKAEFYSNLNLKNKKLNLVKLLAEWENFYNRKRPHASLRGKTPWEKFKEMELLIPLQGEVTEAYWGSNHELMPRNSKYYAWLKEHSEYMKNFPI